MNREAAGIFHLHNPIGLIAMEIPVAFNTAKTLEAYLQLPTGGGYKGQLDLVKTGAHIWTPSFNA